MGVVDHNSLIGRLAPDMTTVSKPKRNPESAATMIHLKLLDILGNIRVRTHISTNIIKL